MLNRILFTLALLPLASVARADLFELANGGHIRGELVNPTEEPRTKYVVKTVFGGTISLSAELVDNVKHERPALLEYEAVRAEHPDTVEGQWEVAEWCREQRLDAQREAHLKRIVELDPNHTLARRALGYSRHGDRWLTREQLMTERGYLYYKGRWRLPQEIELMEDRRRIETAENQWIRELDKLRRELGTDRFEAAVEKIRAIDDPLAIKAIMGQFVEERIEKVKLLYIESLANIGGPGGMAALTRISLEDDNTEVRLSAIDVLKKTRPPESIDTYIGALKSKNNATVNRAAVGLRYLDAKTAVAPLIESLVTTQKYKVTTGGGPNSISTTFGSGGGGAPGGLSVGGKTMIYSQLVHNQDVLDALVLLTGMNYGYDETIWRTWYAAVRRNNTGDVRRD